MRKKSPRAVAILISLCTISLSLLIPAAYGILAPVILVGGTVLLAIILFVIVVVANMIVRDKWPWEDVDE